jgi:hypothetical protein
MKFSNPTTQQHQKFLSPLLAMLTYFLIMGFFVYNHYVFNKYTNQIETKDWVYKNQEANLQENAIQQDLKFCMNHWMEPENTMKYTVLHISISYNYTQNVYNDIQTNCSHELIQKVALTGNTPANALVYFLINKGISVPVYDKKYAKQDDLALASLNLQ